MNQQQQSLDLRALQQMLGGSMIWVGLAFLSLGIVAVKTIRVEKVSGEQVGFLLNKINGKVDVIDQSGTQIYNGLTKHFYVLDKTLQTMEMTESVGRGDRQGKDDLKVKTVDGSDVYVDLKVQYRIIAELADDVLLSSGAGDNYKTKWARDYIRSICRNYLGELKTEEFYNASLRETKVDAAKKEINDRLSKYGIRVASIVIPRRPHFYKEYEDMIRKKKLADQGVLEEQSKALAAKQKQNTLIVQETNKKNVAVEQYKGLMQQKIISAGAQAEKIQKAADAYYEQQTINAGAQFYQMSKTAEGTLALKKAEAAGIMALKKALEGEGGRNMVKLEYAKKLKHIRFEGKPFTVQGNIERFEHLEGAASTGRRRK